MAKSLSFCLSFLFIYLLQSTSAVPLSSSKCYCSPSDTCWPTAKDLNKLSQKLSSSSALLTDIRPPAAVCHVDDPSYDPVACGIAQTYWNNSDWRITQPGGMIEYEFEAAAAWESNKTIACPIDSLDNHLQLPCGQGAVPTFGVNVTTEQDIVEALDFAAKHNLQISVKNTGHDYFGRSLIPGSFMIWTRNLKKNIIEPQFVAESCPQVTSQQALRLGSGVEWMEAYLKAMESNRQVIGGVTVNGTVGASGGWLAGGGHSVLSPMYGLGVDNVLEFRVVLPPNEDCDYARVVVANECSEPDLFWALRGGGGGTFGIVTEVVYQTHEVTKVYTGGLSLATNSSDTYQSILETFLAALPSLADDRFGGYWFTSATPRINTEGQVINTTYSLIYYFLRANYTDAEMPQLAARVIPLFENIQSTMNSSQPIYQTAEYPNFFSWFEANNALMGEATSSRGAQSPIEQGGTYTLSSRLIPADVHVGKKGKEFAQLLMTVSRTFVCATPGGAVSLPDPASMGLNPAWRSAVSHMLLYDSPEENAVRSTTDVLMNLIGGDGGGAYLNEASYTDPAWPRSYWGDNYSRLKDIKKRYDSNHRFVVTRGVSSEEWEEDLRCRK